MFGSRRRGRAALPPPPPPPPEFSTSGMGFNGPQPWPVGSAFYGHGLAAGQTNGVNSNSGNIVAILATGGSGNYSYIFTIVALTGGHLGTVQAGSPYTLGISWTNFAPGVTETITIRCRIYDNVTLQVLSPPDLTVTLSW